MTDSDILTAYYTVLAQNSIAAARVQTQGSSASVAGTVTFTDGRNVVIQDGTAGIFVDFGSSGAAKINGTAVALGDVISVVGTLGVYGNQLQLASPVAEKTGTAALPAALEKNITELNTTPPNTLEGTRVKLSGVLLGVINASGDTYVSIGDQKISLYKMPALDSGIYEGCTVTVTGVLGRYNTAPQIRVAQTSDVVLVSQPTKVSAPVPSSATGSSLQPNAAVTFSCPTPGAAIQYNTSSAAATEWTAIPSGGLVMPNIVGDYTVYIRAVKDGMDSSDVLTLKYSIGQASLMTIATARKAAVGDQVYIKGIIIGDTGGSSGFYVQDDTAGLCVYAKLADFSGAKVGDEVTIRAYVVAPFNGLFEIGKKDESPVQLTVTNAEPTVPTPLPVTVAMLNTGNYQGRLVRLTGVTLSVNGGTGGAKNHTITQNGATVTFRANLSSAYPQGSVLNVLGVASTYNTVQLIQQKVEADNGVTAGTPDEGTVGDPIEKLVVWSAAGNTASASYPATSGVNKDGATLSTSVGVTPAAASGRGFSASGWNGGTDKKYWQIQFSTKGACDIAVSATHSSSATGPSSFYAQYSLDGTTFQALPGGEVVLGAVSGQTYGQVETKNLLLPPDANNRETVYIRWVMGKDGQFGVPASAVAAGGTSQINGIVISGTEYYGPNDVAPVKATPSNSSPVAQGTFITLTSATAGTTIYYTTDGSAPSTESASYSDFAPIELTTLPMTIKAIAVKGEKVSMLKEMTFTQIKLDAVSSSKLDNSLISPTLDRITLSAKKGVTIQYRVNSGDWTAYTAPVALTAEQFPVTLEAKATAEGCLDSEVSTFHYTLSAGEPKNYFGQLHSHTTASDGAGSLEDALKYIWNTARSNNVQFVSFTDHSNYFDGSDLGGVNPAGALYDMGLAPELAQAKWSSYKSAVAAFNTAHSGEMLALAGFEMTWSGGPGHINTFNTPGIVSRNNTELNDKTNASKDQGMQNYYDLLSQSEGATSVSQFNHPGTTFGTFSEFAYWDPIIDQRISLVEVGNGEGAIGSGGYFPSYSEYTKALDKGWHVAPTNNQDNHKGYWGDANTARSVIYTNDFTEQGLYQAMKDRRVYATEDKNLNILYTVNGMVMGTLITDVPETLSIKGVINDPDTTDRISKVELIVNGGRVHYTWSNIDSNSYTAEVTFTKEEIKDYSYFYLRITEADKDIAVTAPVWVGAPVLTGVASLVSGTSMPVIGEAITFTSGIFNNEDVAATLTSVSYTANGEPIPGAIAGTTIPSMGAIENSVSYTPTTAGTLTIEVTAVVTVNGKASTYTKSVTITVLDPATMPYIGIDGSHYNEYVSGNYKDNMGNFGLLAFSHNTRTNILNTSADLIAACANEKYKMLVLTVPSRRDGTSLRSPYGVYNDAEIAAIKTFAENGGIVVVTGWSDLYENYTSFPAEDHMAAQQNKLLAAIGSSLRISDDGVIDKTHAASATDTARLYLSNYNFDNPLTASIVFDADHIYDGQNNLYTQVFSQYGGTSVYAVDGGGNPTNTLPASVSPLVSGFTTTESSDRDGDGLGGASTPRYPTAEGNKSVEALLLAATETVTHAGGKTSLVVVAGGAFMSNFEIQSSAESDNNATLGYSNYNILENLIELVNPPVITDIANVQAAPEGETFTVEGIVTANASGYDKDTAFFDCTYVQDATGGINVFPVSGKYRVGQKVRITGVTSSYQGERQLAVTSIKLRNSMPIAVEPRLVTTEQANSGSALGQLIKIQGVIVDFTEEVGAIQTIMVRDASGIDARVFIDGYITKEKDAALKAGLAIGNMVTVVGLSSYDSSFAGVPNRIRIRDRADIVTSSIVSIPPTGFASGLAGAENDAFMREGVVLATPTGKETTAVAVTGTLAYKQGFTGFWEDNAAMQSGNFLGLRLTLPNYAGLSPVLTFGDKTITVPDGDINGSPFYDFIKRIDPTDPDFTITVDLDGDAVAYSPVTYRFDLSGLTLSTASTGSTATASATVTVGDDSIQVKLSSVGAKLTAAANSKVIAANATKPVVISGGGLNIVIPAGTLTAVSDVNAMLVNPKASGSVIRVTKADGTTVILPIGVVSGGKAAYVANIPGTYEVIDNTKTFPDTGNHWAGEAIGFVSSRELFKGDGVGNFNPDQPMTRGMLATVLARIDGGKAASGTPFADVSDNAWYAKAVAWASQSGLVEGDGMNFNPDGLLTREQLCVILIRYLDYSGLTLPETAQAGGLSDLNTVSPWAAEAVERAIKLGLISGKSGGLLDPKGQATRAEIATIVQRFVEGVLK